MFEIPCPHCGQTLEFFKDDSQRACKGCGHKVLNPKIDFGCASYCPYAEQCLGALPPELAAKQGNLLRDKLTTALRRALIGCEEEFQRRVELADRAEELCREQAVNTPAVVAATLLHDLPQAEELLDRLGLDAELAGQIQQLLDQDESEPSLATALSLLRQALG